MNDLINITNIPTVDILSKYPAGQFRFVVKPRSGFLTVVDSRDWENERFIKYPETIISGYKKGALQTVQFQPEGSDIWLTVFARQGKKIHLIDRTIMKDLSVGTVNSMFFNTELYNWQQYKAANTKTWASKVFVMNQPELV